MTTLLRIKKLTLFLTSFILISLTGMNSAKAQFDGSGDILLSGVNDANLLLKEYLRPFGNGFGADLNSGWVNSARPYRTLGFDLRVSVAGAYVPVGDRSFLVDNLDFENLQRVDGPAESQTSFGDNVPGSVMGVFANNPISNFPQEVTRFTMPQGSGYPYVPAPMLQLTVGAIKDTDVSLRYSPTVTMDDFSVSLFGVGVKHGLNQWLPGGALLPVDLSVQVGYTKLSSNFGLELRPEEGEDIYNPFSGTPSLWDDQKIDFEATGFTGNLLVGKNFPMLAVFGGVGFQTSKVSFLSPGSYPITGFNPDFDFMDQSEETRQRIIEQIDDPIDVSFNAENTVHALAGFRVRLGFVALSGSYTLSNYPVYNLGVGISFR
ncbi:MAG: hypothetical protein EA390_04425 [Balneolaceae bacterium]|nr:MAG: hypothetical protein EA390_04425 [Balneolaceae bacterium]